MPTFGTGSTRDFDEHADWQYDDWRDRRDAAEADAAERHFEAQHHERIAEDTRAALVELCATDREVAAAYLDYCIEFGNVTREQFVRTLERDSCELWTSEFGRQACELANAMGEQ